jgi:hypothetical protein
MRFIGNRQDIILILDDYTSEVGLRPLRPRTYIGATGGPYR